MQKLEKLLTQTATDVVKLQKIFDKAFIEEVRKISPFIEQHQELNQLANQAILPSRMFVKKQEFTCKVCMEQNRNKGFEIDVKIIPLQLEMLLEKDSIHQQNISICIEQVRLKQNPFNNT